MLTPCPPQLLAVPGGRTALRLRGTGRSRGAGTNLPTLGCPSYALRAACHKVGAGRLCSPLLTFLSVWREQQLDSNPRTSAGTAAAPARRPADWGTTMGVHGWLTVEAHCESSAQQSSGTHRDLPTCSWAELRSTSPGHVQAGLFPQRLSAGLHPRWFGSWRSVTRQQDAQGPIPRLVGHHSGTPGSSQWGPPSLAGQGLLGAPGTGEEAWK